MGTDIDHFWPKAEYPRGAFCWNNYLLARSHCNSNEKRNRFPRDANGAPLLIDPTAEDPSKHLLFIPSNGEFADLDSRGQSTIEVFGLNDDAPPRRLPTGRKRALEALKVLLVEYDRKVRAGDSSARETRAHITEYPFSSVLAWLIAAAAQPGAKDVLGSRLVRILRQHQVAEWLD